MSAISIGPLLFSTERFAAIIGIGAFLLAVAILARLLKNDAAQFSFGAIVTGIAAARIGHVLLNWETFGAEPLRVFYVWQGGFSLGFGLVGLALYAVLRARRLPLLGTLAGGTFMGLAAWALVLVLTRYSVAIPLPDQLLERQGTGEQVALSDFAGRPMVVNLWASWCPPCRRELPMMSEVAKHTPGVTFAFVNQGDPEPRIKSYLADQNISLDLVLVDPSWQTATHYGAKGLPTTLFINADGRVVDTVVGEISLEGLSAHLNEIAR